MRKRCKRKVWQVQAIPVVFGMRTKALNDASLLARQCLDALLTSQADEEHIASVESVTKFCVAMVARLIKDRSIDEAAGAAATEAAEAGRLAIESVRRRFAESGKVGCSGQERLALIALMDLNDEIDKVATRRQSRDIVELVFAEISLNTSKPSRT